MKPTDEVLLYTKHGKWEPAPRQTKGQLRSVRVGKSFGEIALYYANICDYVRVLLSIASLLLILHAPEWKLTIASSIMGNVLLDWVDGPLARNFGQSSIFGCGADWLADILAQYGLAVWMTALRSELPLWVVTFTVIFTTVEIAAGLLDFAISATGSYPSQNDTSTLPWYLRVEHFLTPNGSYNYWGTAAWLVNTAFPLSYCVGAPAMVSWAMIPLAMLYAWHECAQLVFILENWQETVAEMYSK